MYSHPLFTNIGPTAATLYSASLTKNASLGEMWKKIKEYVTDAITGVPKEMTANDAWRLLLMSAGLPIGIGGLYLLRLHGSSKLFGKPENDVSPAAITLQDYYQVIQEERDKNKKETKTGMQKTAQDVINRLIHVVSRYPIPTGIFLATSPLLLLGLREALITPASKAYTRAELKEDKMNYLRNLRNTTLLLQKSVRGNLSEQDLKRVDPEAKRLALQKLQLITGKDYSDLFNPKKPAVVESSNSQSESSEDASNVKQGFLGILTLPASAVVTGTRLLGALPLVRFSSGVATAAQARPMFTDVKTLEDEMKEWKGRVFPYLSHTRTELPPPEFFSESAGNSKEEVEEEVAAITDLENSVKKVIDNKLVEQDTEKQVKDVQPSYDEVQERNAANRYIRQRLKELEEAEIKEKKVRGTKIVSK